MIEAAVARKWQLLSRESNFMKIKNIRTLFGPNIFHHKPVLIMTLDLEELAETASSDLKGFKEKLLHFLPGLAEHRCSPGYPGGFVERLERGTYFGHIIEHLALEMSTLAGIEVGYGKTVYGGEPGVYLVVVRFKSEAGMKHLLETAVELAAALVNGQDFNLEDALNKVDRIIRRNRLGPSTQAIVSAAEKRNIPWQRLNDLNLIQLGYGKYRKLIQATTTSSTSDISVDIAQDKSLTKTILEGAGVRVPQGRVVHSHLEALEAMVSLKSAVAVKPLDGNQGKGVSLHVKTTTEMERAFQIASEYSESVLVEELFQGHDYRLLVVGGKLVAASLRRPASVTGDGVHTVSELIEIENGNPLRGFGHEAPLTKIMIDSSSERYLERQKISLNDILPKEQTLFLRETANLSTGGCAEDVTDLVHPDIKAMCERATRIIGLDICGIDLIADQISAPLNYKQNGIIEVNAGPGIRMHHYPSRGLPRDVGGAIIDHLYPAGSKSRIPIISVTGTNGKTTVTRLVQHLLKASGKVVGMTTSSGIYVDGAQVAAGDTTGPVSAKTILCDPGIEVAVLETARGGIARRGLGFDWCDVGVITNVQSDHIGQDGIEGLDDILKIKQLVVERVREGGTIVLNFDDEALAKLPATHAKLLLGKKLVFFSLFEPTPALQVQIDRGITAYYLRNDQIFEVRERQETFFSNASEVPLTIFGTARFQTANVLAAVACARAQGLSRQEVLQGLQTFTPLQNGGRSNIFAVEKGHVVVDYGHNPDALKAIGGMVAHWNASRITGVITAPGDRSDDMIKMSGTAAALVFDQVIIREDEDLRGRPAGQTAGLLSEAIKAGNPSMPCRTILNSHEALETGIKEMIDGEVLVYFYDELSVAEEIIGAHQGKRTEIVPGLVRRASFVESSIDVG